MKKHRTVVPDFSRKTPHPRTLGGKADRDAPAPAEHPPPPALPKPHSTSQKSGRRGS